MLQIATIITPVTVTVTGVIIVVGCCLATKYLILNNMKWNRWGVAFGC